MSLVVCLSCKKIVWAYDHDTQDIRGVANMLKLPCPKCGAIGNFDGWAITDWERMHEIAAHQGYAWEPDGYNRWLGEDNDTVAGLLAMWSSNSDLLATWAARTASHYNEPTADEARDSMRGQDFFTDPDQVNYYAGSDAHEESHDMKYGH